MLESQALLESPRFRNAKKELLDAIAEAGARVRGIRPPSQSSEARESFLRTVQEFNRNRGRDIFYPFLSSGIGSGPYVELLDGSVKLDLITGIGVNFFGHSHPELMAEMVNALPSDVMQGNLQPGAEAEALLRALLSKVGAGSKIKHAWITTCGTMANETALKIIRQKKSPATRVLAFKDCFSGRSTAMQEITDNPGYRQGQPVYGEVQYLSFYKPELGQAASIEKTLGEMKEILTRYPDKFCALMTEPVQGEGGFNFAPREFYVRVFEAAKKAGLAVWLDEIQTFARTGRLFAYQTFGLDEYVDVVTIAKTLQTAAVLYSEEYNPKPGLVAGTFSSGSAQLRVARKVLEMLDSGGYFGPEGKIERLSARFVSHLSKMKEKGLVSEIRAIGGMIAFAPLSGTMEQVKAVLMKLFDQGVVAFYCGHGPYLIRALPPFGVMTEADIDLACGLIEKTIGEVKSK